MQPQIIQVDSDRQRSRCCFPGPPLPNQREPPRHEGFRWENHWKIWVYNDKTMP